MDDDFLVLGYHDHLREDDPSIDASEQWFAYSDPDSYDAESLECLFEDGMQLEFSVFPGDEVESTDGHSTAQHESTRHSTVGYESTAGHSIAGYESTAGHSTAGYESSAQHESTRPESAHEITKMTKKEVVKAGRNTKKGKVPQPHAPHVPLAETANKFQKDIRVFDVGKHPSQPKRLRPTIPKGPMLQTMIRADSRKTRKLETDCQDEEKPPIKKKKR